MVPTSFFILKLLVNSSSLAAPEIGEVIPWFPHLSLSSNCSSIRAIMREQGQPNHQIYSKRLLGNVTYRDCCALVLINLIISFTFFLFSFPAGLRLLLGAWLLPFLRLQCFPRSHFGSGSLRQSRCRGCHRRNRAVRFFPLVICKISRFNLLNRSF